MEGPLSKWTNVMQGWQYRWFVLDDQSGILTYYTSKDKMIRGQRRGCVRLKGAVLGIDDEDESTFTITVDQKMFHFQSRDAEERERWIRALESAINRHSGYYRTRGRKFIPAVKTSVEEFEKRIAEADGYLQIIIDQVKTLEERATRCDSKEKAAVTPLLDASHALLESVKHSIVLLQIAKGHVFPTNGIIIPKQASAKVSPEQQDFAKSQSPGNQSNLSNDDRPGPSLLMPARSYSSSEEEDDFYDTMEALDEPDDLEAEKSQMAKIRAHGGLGSSQGSLASVSKADNEPDFADSHVDFDALHDQDEEDELDSVQEHGSVIMHLLSQVSVGMDLTKIVLPTFILERRSLLEMYADFFAHPDIVLHAVDLPTPEERMVQVVKWYLSAFHAGRKSSVAKKPYNPILGETFACCFDVPGLCDGGRGTPVDSGPVPGSGSKQLTFMAEQVSHHPPISAFYAEHIEKRVQFDAHIWTKSKFLGLSIGVNMVGQGCVSLLSFGEEYIVTFPNGYGRSILTTPWVELGGKCSVTCARTGYNAEIEFLTKPFYGGKTHCIKAEVFRPTTPRTAFLTIKGQWNGVMTAKSADSSAEYVFLDVSKLDIVRKQVKPVSEQSDYESRRLWRHVTAALKERDVQRATRGKHWLEQRQRTEAKERQAKGAKWETKHFAESGEHWIYKWPLQGRIAS